MRVQSWNASRADVVESVVAHSGAMGWVEREVGDGGSEMDDANWDKVLRVRRRADAHGRCQPHEAQGTRRVTAIATMHIGPNMAKIVNGNYATKQSIG